MKTPELEESKAVLWKQGFQMNTGVVVGLNEICGVGAEVLWKNMARSNKDTGEEIRLYKSRF